MNHQVRTPRRHKKWVVEMWGVTSFPAETKGVLRSVEMRAVRVWPAETRGIAFCPVETRCDWLISEITVSVKALIKVFTAYLLLSNKIACFKISICYSDVNTSFTIILYTVDCQGFSAKFNLKKLKL